MVYLDSVHAGPHHLVDVRSIDCDFLVVSAYKFFGPHTGILFGKLERLAEVEFYKVRPAPSDPPDKLETGTQSFESIAGVTAAVDYLAGLGDGTNRRDRLVEGYRRIREHERPLSTRFIEGVTGQGTSADEAAARLSQAGLYVWSGHYYALNALERLGLLETGGLLRIGFVHYNTEEEVDRALEALAEL